MIQKRAFHDLNEWIKPIERLLEDELLKRDFDGSHDKGHLHRVSILSRLLTKQENGDELVAYVAAMLHDIVNLPKNHPNSKNSSFLAAEKSKILLQSLSFPKPLIEKVAHAIHAHSFSANVEAETIEAKCLQDADRMEALGALGLIRVFYVSGKMESKIMHEMDPEALKRSLNDKEYALDHFPLKLFTLQETMKTAAGRKIAHSLSHFIKEFRQIMIQDHLKDDKEHSPLFRLAEHYYLAGQKNLILFDLEDPFAKRRSQEPQKYALDGLLDDKDSYIRTFIGQLKFELDGYSPID